MIRAIVTAIVVMLALNFIALLGVVGWLYSSGRLNEERVKGVVDTFEMTIDEQEQRQAQAKQEAEVERQKALEAARLEAVSDGPQTIQDRLAAEQRRDELAMHRVERMQRETDQLQEQMERAKELVAEQQAQLKQERDAFQQAVDQHNEQQQSEDFQQTVSMYEQLDAAQTKQMFQQLLDDGEQERVVDYLAEMQLRKSAKIIEEFETPAEIEQATTLLEKLRTRGVYPLGGEQPAGGGAGGQNGNGAPAQGMEGNA